MIAVTLIWFLQKPVIFILKFFSFWSRKMPSHFFKYSHINSVSSCDSGVSSRKQHIFSIEKHQVVTSWFTENFLFFILFRFKKSESPIKLGIFSINIWKAWHCRVTEAPVFPLKSSQDSFNLVLNPNTRSISYWNTMESWYCKMHMLHKSISKLYPYGF